MAKEALPTDHPLLELRGRRVGEYTLDVEAWPGRFVGQAEFVVYLQGAGRTRSDRPVVEGLYGRTKIPGSAAEIERGILDIVLACATNLDARQLKLRGSELEREIVGALAKTIADAWSTMMYLAYGWKTLKQIQGLGHPLQVTDEGYLLFIHGFRGGWKDYYYSEGWLEGPIKLKAERPPTAEYRSRWDAENAHALLGFLKRPPIEGRIEFQEEGSGVTVTVSAIALEGTARSRALLMLGELGLMDPDLLDARDRILNIYPSPQSVEGLSPGDLQALSARAIKAW
ncbi:MAG: DUF1122 family protein [candidate division NC10 bacterium]|nr:DUF1122 family protein [candidate division NC10 bacterium]